MNSEGNHEVIKIILCMKMVFDTEIQFSMLSLFSLLDIEILCFDKICVGTNSCTYSKHIIYTCRYCLHEMVTLENKLTLEENHCPLFSLLSYQFVLL